MIIACILPILKRDLRILFVIFFQNSDLWVKDFDKEYPKLNELIKLKDELLKKRNTPPMFVKTDLKNFDLTTLGKFDVILVDPPWDEYARRASMYPFKNEEIQPWTLDEIGALNIDSLAETHSFLFLWVGSENLENGRELFRKWGYKRCEDICWVKTNKESLRMTKGDQTQGPRTYLQRVKEHCLVGLKGDVKRASDAHFIHANIDTDVIVEEEKPGSRQKPSEIYSVIERFCLGRRRIELFATTSSIRPGWLSLGKDLPETNYDQQLYDSWFMNENPANLDAFEGGRFLGTTVEIEHLRPKSPGRAPQVAANIEWMKAEKHNKDFYQNMYGNKPN